jgi:general L-amino acid transport system substrate-binding protein
VQSGTTTEKNLTDFSKRQQPEHQAGGVREAGATNSAYFAGRCQAYTTDASGLASVRSKEAKDPKST